jgi:ribosomal protein S27AE
MAVLKYYKVDSDGKIKRLRRECPSAECGAGIFMAWHENRQYCVRSAGRMHDSMLTTDAHRASATSPTSSRLAPPRRRLKALLKQVDVMVSPM